MRRSLPESVAKRDGRRAPFDLSRLAASMEAALRASGGERVPAAELADVVAASLAGQQQCSTAALAERVEQVLSGAGCAGAAGAYRCVGQERARARSAFQDGWSKGSLLALLPEEDLAAEVAADVERGLFASRMAAPTPGLLAEWVDAELLRRGRPARLGRAAVCGLKGAEIRAALDRGGSEQLARELLARYAATEILPAAFLRAQRQGLLDVDSRSVARPESACLPLSALPELRASGGGVYGELALLWDGGPLGTEHLLASAGATLCIGDDEVARTALAALGRLMPVAGLALPIVRLILPGLQAPTLEAAEALERRTDRLQFAQAAPPPGLVRATVSLDLGRLESITSDGQGLAMLLDAAQAALDALGALGVRPCAPLSRLPARRQLALRGARRSPAIPDSWTLVRDPSESADPAGLPPWTPLRRVRSQPCV